MREEDAVLLNRSHWDQRADVHVRSRMYDVEGLLADRSAVSGVVRNDLAVLGPHLGESGVRGKPLLHLQCHIGTDTVSWARLGAVGVAGLDLSPNSLRHARRIAEADGQAIEWVEGDARSASTLIERRFEVVVTSTGTIVWLPELVQWARSIHDLLFPGGVFLIRDDHPILAAMELQPWQVTGDYLSSGEALRYENTGTYTEDSEGRIGQTVNYEWRHDFGEIFRALLGAGLRIEAFAELPYMDWPAFPELVPGEQGWVLPAGAPRVPLNFAIVARRVD